MVVRQRIVNQRLIPNPMEVRGDIGLYNPGTDEYTIWMSSQTPHIQRLLLAAFVTGIPEHKVRCISPDVGGAFGTKIFCYADMALVMLASKLIGGRPVKWVETRRENYQSTIHGRDHITYLEIAGNRDGEVTGLRVKTFANLGGRLSTIGPGIPTTLYGRVLSGCYKIPNVYCEVTGVYTNTTFVDAYRGAGRPEATYVIERAMDLFAAEIGMDRAEVRRRNFIAPDAFPYDNPSGLGTAVNGEKIFIDSGNYEPALDKALAMVGYADLDAAKAEARTRGKYLGLGLSTYIEVCGVAPSKWIGAVGEGWGAAMWESANLKVHLTGKVVLTMGTQPQGQGHETTYSQIIASELGLADGRHHRPALGHPGHAVRLRLVRQPDLVGRQHGRDQGGRQGPREGPALRRPHARGVGRRHRGRSATSTGSRARPRRRRPSRRSPSRSTSGSACPRAWSRTSTRPPTTTRRTAPGRSGPTSRSSRSTRRPGKVDLVRYVAVDDVGKKINPMIVDGQLHGGIVQGVGQALWEEAVYGDDGQLLSGSMLDYALPRASWLPNLELDETVTPSPVNPIGVKGVGEAGAIASTAAVANAVIDALSAVRRPSPRHALHRAQGLARDALRGGPVVIPAAFEYDRPSSVDRGARDPRPEPRHGQGPGRRPEPPRAHEAPPGPARAARRHRPARASLRGIRELPDGGIAIGALVTYREVLDSELATDRVPLLAMTIADIGDVQVRNRGTLAGSIAHADPASDMPAIVARARCPDRRPVRRTASGSSPRRSFFEGAFVTDLAEDELLTEIRIPAQPTGGRDGLPAPRAAGLGLLDRRRRRGRRADGRLGDHARIGVTGVGEVAYRARAVEAALVGTAGDRPTIAAAAGHAADGVTVGSDIHADAVYRAEMARVHVRRAIEAALAAAD